MRRLRDWVGPWQRAGDQFARTEIKDGVLTRIVFDPWRAAKLRWNKRLRDAGAVRKGEVFQHKLSIPTLDYTKLVRANPDLEAPDGWIKKRAWDAFIASDASEPYRMQ